MERKIPNLALWITKNRNDMVKFFLLIFDFLHHRKNFCYGLLAAITLVLFITVSSLRYNEDIYDFLPMDDNQQKAITIYQDITGGKRIVAMLKMKRSGKLDTERLSKVVDSFSQRIKDNDKAGRVKEVVAQVDFEKITGLTDFVYQNIPMMLQDSDYVHMERILSEPKHIEEQLTKDIQMIMMPATGYFANNIGNDPLGLFTPLMNRLQEKQASTAFKIEDGYIFTSDRRYAIVMMTSAYGSMESANNTLLVNFIDSISRQTMQEFPDIDIAITGSPVIAVDNANQIKTDSKLAIIIAVILILCLLLFSFRSVKNIFLIGISILFGWLFAMAFIAVLRENVSLIVLGIGSIIIGIAVNYPLHFIAHVGHGGSIRDVLKDMVSPLLIGNITTVGAFAILIPLDAPALRDLGLFAAFMLVGTILFVLIFLPHLVKKTTKHKEYLLFGKVSSMTPKIGGWMFGVIVLLTMIFGYFSLDTTFDANMHHINYLTPTQQHLMADLNISAGINDSTNVYVVTEGKSWEKVLQERSSLKPLLEELKGQQKIKAYTNVTDFICSEQEQNQRICKWNEFWEIHRDITIHSLHSMAPQIGFSNKAFAGFEDIITKNYSSQPFDYYEPLTSVLLGQSFSTSNGKCSIVDIAKADKNLVPEVERIIKNFANEHVYSFDFNGMNSSVANALSDDFNYIGFACGVIVFLFLWLSFGRLELSLLTFLPMALGWIWILGIMNIIGMQFNIVNIILATFIFGQGDDYTIFMTDGLINDYAYHKKLLPSYKNSIIISALIMFIGMGSLIVAKHPALHSLAEVTIVGMLTVVLMTWIVPPMVFNWLTKTNGYYRKHPVTIEHLIRTSYCTLSYLLEIIYGCVLGLIIKLLPYRKEKINHWFHRVIHKIMQANIRHIWGVKSMIHNKNNENFVRGSIIISNHQSILDPILFLALSPNILILISKKVWKNPVVHILFKLAGFINLDQPMETLKEEISKAVEKGYNIVLFPEGKRNEEHITRFHKGAFYIAQEIGADILPVYLHGVGHVMPKGSGFASRGQIDLEVGKRISAKELSSLGTTDQLIAHHFQIMYQNKLEQWKKEIETAHYFRTIIISMYTYKGIGIEIDTKRLLKQYGDFSLWIDNYKKSGNNTIVSVVNAGRGQFSMMFALVYPEIEVHSYPSNEDDEALAKSCIPVPPNLHIHSYKDTTKTLPTEKSGNIIDLTKIITHNKNHHERDL